MTDIHVKTRMQTSDCKSLSNPVTFLLTIFNIGSEMACFVYLHKAGHFLVSDIFRFLKRYHRFSLLEVCFFSISEETGSHQIAKRYYTKNSPHTNEAYIRWITPIEASKSAFWEPYTAKYP